MLFAIPLVLALIPIAMALLERFRDRARPPQRVLGPYRGTITASAPRPVSRKVRFAASATYVWGLVSLLVITPLGLIASLYVLEGGDTGAIHLSDYLWVLPLLGISLATIPLCIALFHQSMQIRKRNTRSIPAVVRWSLLHYLACFVVCIVPAVASMSAMGLSTLIIVGIPCLVGTMQALALSEAAEHLGREGLQPAGSSLTSPPACAT